MIYFTTVWMHVFMLGDIWPERYRDHGKGLNFRYVKMVRED